MRNLICFLSIILYGNYSFSQNAQKYKDSIQTEIEHIKSDSIRAQRFYSESNYALRTLNDLELSRTYLDSSMHYSKISGFKESEAKCHFLYGLLERVSGNYSKALDHLHKNINYFKNDSINRAYALFQVGIIHRNQGNYEKSLQSYLEILDIFETKKDSFAIASTLNSIANIYGDMDKYDGAISNYKKANAIFVGKNDKRNQSNTLQNISEIYLRKSDTTIAREYAEQSLKIAKEIDEEYAIGSAYHVLGRTYLSTDRGKALNSYLRARESLERINFKRRLVSLYNDLGDFYKIEGDISQSLFYYQKALGILGDTNELLNLKNTYEGLSINYALTNDFEKAYDYQKLFIEVNDSLFNIENVKSINLLQKQFEAERKDKEIATQQLELVKKESEIQKEKTQKNYMLGTILFLAICTILMVYLFKQRQKRKNQELQTLKREFQIKTLESLIAGEEKERLRVAKELHDGINGDLAAIKYKLSSLLEMNNKVIQEAIAMIDDSCKQVRAISHNLIPPSLENFDLLEAAQIYCSNLNEAVTEVEIHFQHIGEGVGLSKKEEINIFRIIQELVNNSLRHAQAEKIDVQISSREDTIQITVEDDGKGFDKDQLKSDGIGLTNVRSRVAFLNATMDFVSNEKGTSYLIEINKNN